MESDPSMPRSKFKEAQVFSTKEPVLLSAQEVDYDQNADVVTANGNVEISQGQTIILADMLIYDQARNTVHAQGNISMLAPSGDVYFSDQLEFKDDLKAGVIRQFRARLADNSVVVASAAQKVDDNITKMFKAAYTPCKCNDENGNPKSPLWSIKANEATLDNAAHDITYNGAQLDFYDIPIAYSPYFSHATPGAENESGLLTPSFLRSRNLGGVYKQPVYYSIDQSKDVTITPIVTSKVGTVIAGEYRQKFDAGPLFLQGSITNAPNIDPAGNRTYGNQIRGNYEAKGDFKIDDTYDWGFNIKRASDQTYLHLYNFSNESLLTSRIYGEGHNFIKDNDRNYASIEGLSFQGLTAQDNSKVIPVVAPLANVSWQSEPGLYNSRLTLEGNTMALYRITGAESRRASATARLNLPYISDDGQAIEFEGQLRSDIYDVSNVRLANGQVYNGITGREIPQISVTWHYPFVKHMENSNITVEPIVKFTASPGGGNPEKIPNEDSQLPDFTDANLFSSDRFAGLDRVENGARLSYGIRGQAQIQNDKYVDMLIGQEYRVDNDLTFPISNDLNSHVSDYVGRVGVTYAPFNVGYRFRLDNTNLTANRSEWDAGYNHYPFSFNASYLSLKNDPVLASREVVNAITSINLNDNWSITASGSRDLHLDQTVTAYSGIVYKNECVNVTTVVGKDYISLLDIKPSLSFWFRVSLKNLD